VRPLSKSWARFTLETSRKILGRCTNKGHFRAEVIQSTCSKIQDALSSTKRVLCCTHGSGGARDYTRGERYGVRDPAEVLSAWNDPARLTTAPSAARLAAPAGADSSPSLSLPKPEDRGALQLRAGEKCFFGVRQTSSSFTPLPRRAGMDAACSRSLFLCLCNERAAYFRPETPRRTSHFARLRVFHVLTHCVHKHSRLSYLLPRFEVQCKL
jgi:hypothetical protein